MRTMKLTWLAICLGITFLAGCTKEEQQPEEVVDAFIGYWKNEQFNEMYELLDVSSRTAMSREEFVTRYDKIYDGIGANRLTIVSNPVSGDNAASNDGRLVYPYNLKLDTVAGPLEATGKLEMVKEDSRKTKRWRVIWHPSMIFPTMKEGDKVSVQTLRAERGEILDRSGNGLAVNGSIEVIGIIPGLLGPEAQKSKAELAERLEIPLEEVERKLAASWVKDDLFVPIANLIGEQASVDYTDLKGVMRREKKVRVYPYGDAAAHLTGYIRQVTAEDIEEQPDRHYAPDDLIGKAGSEQVYEDVLRGQDGKRVSIVDSSGQIREVLAETAPADGRDVRLTIDAAIQSSIYRALEGDAGTAVALHPQTGEILALVSSPAYDPNAFIVGLSSEQWEAWNTDPDKPLLNRFTKLYSPGSVFKPVTASIGLKLGVSYPDKSKAIQGSRWSKDASWGGYYVTRVKDVPVVNLRDAIVYSDNIYMAQEALEIGKDAFLEEAGRFGFGERLPIQYPFANASLANDGIKNEIQLADSGYGQGEVVMSPLHLALAYTPFINDGQLVQPVLDYLDENDVGESRETAVIDSNTASIIKQMLIDVVKDPVGSGHGAYIQGKEIAGKTGTAELKSSKEEAGQENGWFVAFDAANSEFLLAMMIEHVEGRGGSNYVVNKAAPVLREFFG